jgi:hypothetical protein
MRKETIVAKLDGQIMGSETIDIPENWNDVITDKRFTETERFSCYRYGFMVWRQRLLRDGGLSPDDRKKYRLERQRENLSHDLGYTSFAEMVADIKRLKDATV